MLVFAFELNTPDTAHQSLENLAPILISENTYAEVEFDPKTNTGKLTFPDIKDVEIFAHYKNHHAFKKFKLVQS